MNCKLRRLDLLRNGNKLPKSDCELHVWYTDKKIRSCRKFQCHRIMLMSASEKFESLINNPEFEKNKNVINVDDASPNAYEALLLYIYTYEVCDAINLDMCSELLYLAKKFQMYDFIDCYVGKLANQDWPIDTLLQIFQLANEHNTPAINDLVTRKILPIATQLLNDNSFLKLNVDKLKSLITILKVQEIVPDEDLLLALRKYQVCNNLRYNNMEKFQQFVEVTQLFGSLLFDVDGTITLKDDEPQQQPSPAPQQQPSPAPQQQPSPTPQQQSPALQPSPPPEEKKMSVDDTTRLSRSLEDPEPEVEISTATAVTPKEPKSETNSTRPSVNK